MGYPVLNTILFLNFQRYVKAKNFDFSRNIFVLQKQKSDSRVDIFPFIFRRYVKPGNFFKFFVFLPSLGRGTGLADCPFPPVGSVLSVP